MKQIRRIFLEGERPALIWLRFIADIFFMWRDGEESVREFLAFCQKYNETKNMKSVTIFEI